MLDLRLREWRIARYWRRGLVPVLSRLLLLVEQTDELLLLGDDVLH